MFREVNSEITSLSKRVTANSVHIIVVEALNANIHTGLVDITKRVEEVHTILASVTKDLEEVSLKRDLQTLIKRMEEQIANVQESKTGLTMARMGYKFSESPR